MFLSETEKRRFCKFSNILKKDKKLVEDLYFCMMNDEDETPEQLKKLDIAFNASQEV